ncbi:Calx-beta domain-containing protein [Thalassovita mangrovi]|uniref:Calx-beta domain-containing protein n=1 Tax=Thalassovita mangrovi TaxID=2692236 RepID=A0A6L8LQS2_9RHOB|nr:Calx-beta domain-containing protein [Thalassovita mangrovi]MYM56920.1 hypothetical protein [Thalassovita mangrovi]
MTTYSMVPVTTSVDEDAGSITFTITRSDVLTAETIYFSTLVTEGYANEGDYEGIVNQAVTFDAWDSSATVTVTLTDDSIAEGSERFGAIIQSDPSDPVTIYLDRSTFTIEDDDPASPETGYAMVPVTTSVAEGAGTITFTITRSGDLTAETVYFSTLITEGYANEGDYEGIVNQEVTFGAGESSATVTVTLTDDSITEGSERFGAIIQRNISDPVATYLARSTFTIEDDDPDPYDDGWDIVVLESPGIIDGATPGPDAVTIFPAVVEADPAFQQAIIDLAEKYAIPAAYLLAIMDFETAGTFSPSLQNPISGAVGLLQFTQIGISGWDVTLEQLAAMSAAQQMEWVEMYFDRYIAPGSAPSVSDLYMSVLWPVAADQPDDYVLFSEGSLYYSQNAALDLDGDGEVTKLEASAAVTALIADYLTLETQILQGDGAEDRLLVRAVAGQANDVRIAAEDGAVAVYSNDGDTPNLIVSSYGELHFQGGEFEDRITVEDLSGTDVADNALHLFGAGGDDVLEASSMPLSIHAAGGDGDDLIFAGLSDDAIEGGLGRDTLVGGDGDDTIFGSEADNDSSEDLRDVVYAGAGRDVIDGGYGNDELRGDAGDDTITGGFGADTVIGGTGDDVLTGQALSDLILGGDGMDFINGGFGHDRLMGGDGADRFFHLGIEGHGSDWIQDFDSVEGDVLQFGGSATADQFQVNFANTENAGSADIDEAFVIYRPTGQILWALVDGGALGGISLSVADDVFNLLA